MSWLLNPYRFIPTVWAATATNFDGTNDYIKRSTALTGLVDGKQGTISFWLKKGADSVAGIVAQDNQQRFRFISPAANKAAQVVLKSTTGTALLNFTGDTGHVVADGWKHILMSWDAAVSNSVYLYISDTVDANANGISCAANENVDYTDTSYAIGAATNAASKLNGCLSEVWFDPSYMDLSVTANRRKFIDASGKPVDLGADGSTPTGTSPTIYLPNPFGTFEQNEGTGGDFVVTGALTACADSPSD